MPASPSTQSNASESPAPRSGANAASDASNGSASASAASSRSPAIINLQPLPADAISLEKLAPRLCATVVAIRSPDGSIAPLNPNNAADLDEDTERLKAMGVCIGRRVELVQTGDPLILRVLGSRLGLSARLAQRVMVAACSTNP